MLGITLRTSPYLCGCRLYATKCATCKQPMLSHELCMRTGAEVHHVSCFVCSVCREPLVVGVEYARDPTTGAPVCKPDCLRRSASSIAAVPLATALPSATAVSCKRGRTTLSAEQRTQLQRVFEENPRPPKKVGLYKNLTSHSHSYTC